MITKAFLAFVGILYLALAIWCAADPQTTSNKVGFDLRPGSGESEFVTVYGGLELGLFLIFLLPFVWPETQRYALLSCLMIHGCLVLFRTTSYLRFEDIDSFTHRLAIGEWVILLASLAIWFLTKPANKKPATSNP